MNGRIVARTAIACKRYGNARSSRQTTIEMSAPCAMVTVLE